MPSYDYELRTAPGEAPSTFPSQMEADAHHQSEAESVTTELPLIEKETRFKFAGGRINVKMAGTKRPSSVPQTSPALLAINAHSTAHPAANVFTLRHSRDAAFPLPQNDYTSIWGKISVKGVARELLLSGDKTVATDLIVPG